MKGNYSYYTGYVLVKCHLLEVNWI